MDNQWSLKTHGDPLGAVRRLMQDIWLESKLDGMLVTVNGGEAIGARPHYITDSTFLMDINPFKPLMEINIARLVPGLLTSHSGGKLAALLRPCEMRALIEMTKHAVLELDNLLTICVDCLGTLPADEYQWRLERAVKSHLPEIDKPPEANDELALEALKFARQGGITPYRYRSACQVCASPAAERANINLHILGLPVRQQIIVSVIAPRVAKSIHLEQYADYPADPSLIAQHERVLAKMHERHERTMERVKQELGRLLPKDVDAIVSQLEACGECQSCMDVCPICSVDRPYRTIDGHYDRTSVMRWLVSCAGCGMCEQACPRHLPTAAIFTHIRELLSREWDYVPGKSLDDRLPL